MISVYTFDGVSGALTKQSSIATGGLLSFLTADSNRKFLYAADEGHGLLRSFKVDPSSGDLSPIATAKTDSGAVYISVAKDNGSLLAAQFNGGKTQRFPLHADGTFGDPSATVASGSESHAAHVSPDGSYAVVPSRKTDTITVYDLRLGRLTPHLTLRLPSGSGCRHVDFHPNGKYMYLVNEFDNSLVTFSYDGEQGALRTLQTVSTLPEGFSGESSAADVHVHPNGKFLYATNRVAEQNGTIAAYSIATDGTVKLIDHESTLGHVPRNFEILPDGEHLLIGNQESNSVSSYRINTDSGELTLLKLTELNAKPFFVGAIVLP